MSFFLFFSCFLSDNRIRYGIFLAPLFSVILFNSVVFVMVTRVLLKHSKKKIMDAKDEKNKKKFISSTLKTLLSIVSVMVMYGLSWLFGAFSIDRAAVVFQWLFVIFSTSQGLTLFIFFCIIGQDAREEWKKLLTCYRYDPKKRGPVPSAISSAGRTPRSYGTKNTSLTSRGGNSATLRMSVGLLPKPEKLDFDSVAPVEMDELSPDFEKKDLSALQDVTDSLVLSNGHAKEDHRKVHDTQLPPQILFRLKRPLYDIVVEGSDTNPSSNSIPSSLIKEKEEIDMDAYGESESGDSDCTSDVEYSEL